MDMDPDEAEPADPDEASGRSVLLCLHTACILLRHSNTALQSGNMSVRLRGSNKSKSSVPFLRHRHMLSAVCQSYIKRRMCRSLTPYTDKNIRFPVVLSNSILSALRCRQTGRSTPYLTIRNLRLWHHQSRCLRQRLFGCLLLART